MATSDDEAGDGRMVSSLSQVLLVRAKGLSS
jgi:hypothetical protein